ncbi:nuclear pore complex protein Nup214 [Pseudophryne corroboree]|uniref:nuclear pore complex protein Nup214 n=1 Tax=Pseudophryne corroboree TaxID=495146 RepID=UPI003081F9FE
MGKHTLARELKYPLHRKSKQHWQTERSKYSVQEVPWRRSHKDFQFRQLKKIRFFNPPPDLPKERSSLLALSNKYGLLFAGSPTGFKVFHTKDVLIPCKPGEDPNNIVVGPPGIEVRTNFPVHHLALNTDNLMLSVCMTCPELGSSVSFYDVRTLMNESRQPKEAFASQRLLREADSFVTDLKWNPVASSMVALCLNDGSISILQVEDTVTLYSSLPSSLGVTSVCWSPKGKQLAIGKQNGTIVQYLPTLQEKKVIPCPPFYDLDNPVKVLDVLWVSTYVFAVVYAAADGSLETSPQLVMVLLPRKEDKRGDRFLNFTETCYSSCNERQHHFFMNYIEDWNVLLGASAASIEVSVIARPLDQNTWELWLLEDSSRAEMPVTDNSDDTFPMGVVVDYSSQLEIFISDEKILPPAPVLLVLSTDGLLCPFHVINLNPGVKSLTTALEQLPMGGERQMKTGAPGPAVTPPSIPQAVTPAFSTPVSNLAGNPQPASLGFSIPASSLSGKPQTATQVFSLPSTNLAGKPQTASTAFSVPTTGFSGPLQATPHAFGTLATTVPGQVQTNTQAFSIATGFTGQPQGTASGFGIPTTSVAGKPQPTAPGFGMPSTGFPSHLQVTATCFGVPATSVGSKPQATEPGFGIPATSFTGQIQATPPSFGTPAASVAGKPQATQQAFSLFSTPSATNTSANSSSSLFGPSVKQPTGTNTSGNSSSGLFGTSAKQPSSQSFSFSTQAPVDFGSASPKPENSNSSTQATDSSFVPTSSVKVNLKDKFSAVDTHQVMPGFASSAQNFSFTSQAKSTTAPIASGSAVPSPSPTGVAPSRPFADVTQATPNTPTARVNPPAVRQAPSQPVANASLDNRVKDNDPILNAIKDEIAHFQKEMDDLKARTAKACFTVGSEEQMRQLRTESDGLHSFLQEIKETTESLHGDTGCLKTTLLEAFASVEDAREQDERKKDPKYRQLLYKKPLDPKSEAQMQEIRRLHQYVKFAVQDVNDVLDIEWDRHLQNKRQQKSIAVPERETLFNTLANNQEIIHQQRQRLNQLVESLQQLRLYNQISKWNMPSEEFTNKSFEMELESLRNALPKIAEDKEPKPTPKAPREFPTSQPCQLRNFLTKRKTPGIRSLAPVGLSRSSFLAPSYFEDLDDVSSTSSLSEAADNEVLRAPPQPVSIRRDTPPPEPFPVRPARHVPITRTTSVQPGFTTPSLTFGKSQPCTGPMTSTPAVPAQSIRVIPQGADSTMLATKTVKHGAPTGPAPQAAAAAAALRRQMTSQVPASLTESTLQTVPQVVNVKELKGNGPGPNFATVIGPSVPHSAAQVINQVLATVGSAPAKQVPPPGGLKTHSAPPPYSSVTTQPGSALAPSKITGQANLKSDTPLASSTNSVVTGNKAFPFSSPSGVFSMGYPSSAAPSPLGNAASAKDSNQPATFIAGAGNKLPFGSGSDVSLSFASLKSPSASIAPADSTVCIKPTSAQSPPTVSTYSGVSSTAKPGNGAATQGFAGGETLGSFSGLRVGQAEDAPKAEFPKVMPTTQPAKIPSIGQLTGYTGGFQPSKPVEPSSTTSSSSAMVFGNMQLPSTGSLGGLFNPGGIKPNISVVAPISTAPAADSSSNIQAPALSFGFVSPATSVQTSMVSIAGTPVTVIPSTYGVDSKQPVVPIKSATEPAASSHLQALLAVPTEGNRDPTSNQTLSASGSTEPTAPAAIPAVGTPQPASETKATVLTFPVAVESGQNAPTTSSPVLVSPPPPPASTISVGLPSQTPVLVTTAPATGPTSTQDTSATGSAFVQPSVTSSATTAAPVFGQAQAASTGPTLFGQQNSNSASTSGNPAAGFGSFGVAEGSGGFGQPVFGQTTSFWKAPAGSASNFSFAQSSFGSQSIFGQPPASTAAVSSSGSLFGSTPANTISASSFSFAQPSSSNTSTAGGGLFGQSSAPVFGQSSTFGQSAPLFGSATSTTTTSSSGFSFGQTPGFGSSSSGSVFGQPQNTGTAVFGQQPSSSGGSLFGTSTSGTGGGGFFSGLGGKPSQEAANKNPFSAPGSGFGVPSTSNASSLFGNSGAKTFGFGSSTFGEQKSTGTFSAGGGSVSTQGFGFSSPNKTGGFGAAPVFGSPPTFGGSPGYGGVPAFGSAPSFASPLGSTEGKVFGEGTAAANTGGFGFGSSSGSTTFGNLANQSTPSFGALSQQGVGFGGQSSGFSGFGTGSGGAAPGSGGGFPFGVSNHRFLSSRPRDFHP